MKTGIELENHILGTYFGLRWGLVAIAIAFPLVLAGLGYFLFEVTLQESLSAYYGTPMRDFFVGTLFAVGACLYLYKGFSNEENIVLNLSGALALGIAFLPWNWDPWGGSVTPHGICAVLFFVGIGWVCLRCAKETLRLIADPAIKAGFERKYTLIGCAMIASPVIAFVISGFFPARLKGYKFWVEVVAIAVFAAYWLTKSLELARTKAEQHAAKGAV